MKCCFLMLLAGLIISLQLPAQQTPVSTSNDSIINMQVIHNGRSSTTLYLQHNSVLSSGELVSVLKSRPVSASELNKYYSQKHTVLGILPITLTAMIVGFIQVGNKGNLPCSAFSKAPLAFSIAIGGMVSSLIIGATNMHLQKAIELYNSSF